MASMTNKLIQYPNFTTEELEIIGYFARGQRYSIASKTLRLECSETSVRLIDTNGRLVGISKQTNEWQRKVLISTSYSHSMIILKLLTDRGFIAKQKSSHPDFNEYHYYQVPEGYKLNHTDALELWKVWWNNKRYQLNVTSLPIDLMIFAKGNWFLVKDLQPNQDKFVLKTEQGQLTVSGGDLVVWVDRIEHQSVVILPTSVGELSISIPTEADIQTEILELPTAPIVAQTISQVEPPMREEDLELEAYLNTFNTEDTQDIDRIEGIYNIEELLSGITVKAEPSPPPAPPTPTFAKADVIPTLPKIPTTPPVPAPALNSNSQAPVSISEQKQALKLKAINTLTEYLRDGTTTTHTEIVKDSQGKIIDSKVTTIRHGCPRWTIEQIEQLQDELARI